MNNPIYPAPRLGGLTLDAPLPVGSGGLGNATGDASALTLAGQPLTISITATQIPALTIPINVFRTIGYAAAGDGGDAIYVKATSSGPMAVQDASGQWWALAKTGEWSAKAWGAKGDNATDDTAALNSWLAGCVAYGQSGYASSGVYRHGGLVLDTSVGAGYAIAIRGAHPSQTVFRTLPGTTNAALSIVTGGGGYGGQPQPLLTNFTLDCNYFSSGHGIAISGPTGGYGQGFMGVNVTIIKPGVDALYVGVNAGAGCLIRCSFARPGRNVITLDSGDWRMTDCDFMGAEQAGLFVSAAADNGSGLVRLTVTGHGMTTGQQAYVWAGPSTLGSTGVWTVTVIDVNTLDLQGSTFGSGSGAGVRCVPIFTVIGAANNGAGKIRIQTDAAHGFSTGAQVYLQNVGGVPNANGGWLVTAIDATHFDLQGSQIQTQTYTSGGTACSFTAGVFIGSVNGAPASNQINSCNVYVCMFGYQITCPSGDPLQVNNGSIDSNWLNAVNIQTWGMATPHMFVGGVRYAGNSQVKNGTFADIYLSNTGAERFDGTHATGTNLVSYLIESDGTCVEPIKWQGAFDPVAHPPFAVKIASLTSDMNIPYAQYANIASGTGNNSGSFALVSGSGNNAAGQGIFISGYRNSSGSPWGATLGQYGRDGNEFSLVWGGVQFSGIGDNQTRLIMASCVTTDATSKRLLVAQATTPSSTNTLNLFYNYQSMAYDRITILCKNPATGDTKTWVIDNLVAKRGASASAITLNGSSSTIAPTAVYTSDSALAACAVSLAPDTVNGGIAITATGIAATTLHWSLKASPLEVV